MMAALPKVAQCFVHGFPELLQGEGARERWVVTKPLELGDAAGMGKQDVPDGLEVLNHMRIASCEQVGITDDQVDPHTARQSEDLRRTVADENAIAPAAERLVDQLLRCGVFFQDDDRRGGSSHC
jgi:hypothetical protein